MYSGKNRKYVSTMYIYIVDALNNGFDINGVPEIEVQLCMIILHVAMLNVKECLRAKRAKKIIRAIPLFRTFLRPCYHCSCVKGGGEE